MGTFRFRRSIRLGPGIKMNLTKTGVGLTLGGRGAHYSIHSSGARRTSLGIPGTGLYYQDRTGGSRPSAQSRRARSVPTFVATRTSTPADVVPRPGLFAGSAEKRYHDGVLRYLAGDFGGALTAFEASLATNPDTPSAHLFAYLCLEKTERPSVDRIAHLEAVVQGGEPMPDPLQAHYLPAGVIALHLQVKVTSTIDASAPFDAVGATLMLAEEYQLAGRLSEAIGIVQQLHVISPDDLTIRLSLADLLLVDGDGEGVLDAASTAINDSDVGVGLLQFRAAAMSMLGHGDGAIAALTEALAKNANRNPELLKAVRYDRALALERAGKLSRSRTDLEKLYSIDPGYEDVRSRLGGS